MLTPQDDWLGHQTPAPFARAGGGEPRFVERYWFTAHPLDGSAVILDMGLGYYPNRGVMDAFAGVSLGRRQINFRASRHLGTDPLSTRVGPLRLQIEQAHQRYRLSLDENDSGLCFDLRFEASFPAMQEKQNFRERKGVVEEDLARVAQFGRWSGWFQVDGQRQQLTPAQWWGQRDRSWGIRSEMRTDVARPPVQQHSGFFWTWSMFQLAHSAISLFVKEREPGQPHYLSGSEYSRAPDGQLKHRHITGLEHEIRWSDDPLGQTIRDADFRLHFDGGPPRDLHMQALPARFYLKGGLYGGFGGWNHGDDKGPLYLAHDVWNLEDAGVRAVARTLGDHVMRVHSAGDTGIGISEYGVAAGYPKYPLPQRFPAL